MANKTRQRTDSPSKPKSERSRAKYRNRRYDDSFTDLEEVEPTKRVRGRPKATVVLSTEDLDFLDFEEGRRIARLDERGPTSIRPISPTPRRTSARLENETQTAPQDRVARSRGVSRPGKAVDFSAAQKGCRSRSPSREVQPRKVVQRGIRLRSPSREVQPRAVIPRRLSKRGGHASRITSTLLWSIAFVSLALCTMGMVYTSERLPKSGDIPVRYLQEPLVAYNAMKTDCETTQEQIAGAREHVCALTKHITPCSPLKLWVAENQYASIHYSRSNYCLFARDLQTIEAELTQFQLQTLPNVKDEVNEICKDLTWLHKAFNKHGNKMHGPALLDTLQGARDVGGRKILTSAQNDINTVSTVESWIMNTQVNRQLVEEVMRLHPSIQSGDLTVDEIYVELQKVSNILSGRTSSWKGHKTMEHVEKHTQSLNERINWFDEKFRGQDIDNSRVKDKMDYLVETPEAKECQENLRKQADKDQKKPPIFNWHDHDIGIAWKKVGDYGMLPFVIPIGVYVATRFV